MASVPKLPNLIQPPADVRLAASLSGHDIGKEISFEYKFRSGMSQAIIHAELRQVSHNMGEVHINTCGLEDESEGGLDEFTLAPSAEVWVKVS